MRETDWIVGVPPGGRATAGAFSFCADYRVPSTLPVFYSWITKEGSVIGKTLTQFGAVCGKERRIDGQ